MVLRAFSGADGGNDVDSSEDSWSRFVLCFLLGLELLCFPWDGFYIRIDGLVGGGFLKRPLIREDLKVIHYQSHEADNTFITSDGTSPYTSTRKWAVKRHYREDN